MIMKTEYRRRTMKLHLLTAVLILICFIAHIVALQTTFLQCLLYEENEEKKKNKKKKEKIKNMKEKQERNTKEEKKSKNPHGSQLQSYKSLHKTRKEEKI